MARIVPVRSTEKARFVTSNRLRSSALLGSASVWNRTTSMLYTHSSIVWLTPRKPIGEKSHGQASSQYFVLRHQCRIHETVGSITPRPKRTAISESHADFIRWWPRGVPWLEGRTDTPLARYRVRTFEICGLGRRTQRSARSHEGSFTSRVSGILRTQCQVDTLVEVVRIEAIGPEELFDTNNFTGD